MTTLLLSIWSSFLILVFSPVGTDMSLIWVLLRLGLSALCSDFVGFLFFCLLMFAAKDLFFFLRYRSKPSTALWARRIIRILVVFGFINLIGYLTLWF